MIILYFFLHPLRLWDLMMRKRFILLQALAVLIAVLQDGVGTAGENEGNHCNRIVNSVFYPYLTARYGKN